MLCGPLKFMDMVILALFSLNLAFVYLRNCYEMVITSRMEAVKMKVEHNETKYYKRVLSSSAL